MLVDAKTNDALANKSFSEKKQILLARGYKLPDILARAEDISSQVISQNTERLATLARENIWKV